MKKTEKIKIWIKHVILKKNKKRIGLSNRVLAIKKGFSSEFFCMYNLNKNNIDDYISEYSRYLSREINGDYKIILDDKIIFTEVFSKYVNVPKIIMYNINKVFSDDGKVLDDIRILEILSNKKIIIKPINDGGGHGVHVIENKDNNYFIDYVLSSANDVINLIRKSNNCIVNEYLQQADYSNKIFEKTVNTLRIITIRNPKTGKISIPCAVHRFGNDKTKGVDNASSGGYVTEIDITTGKLGYTMKLNDLRKIEFHPDSNSRIKGVMIPNWKKISKEIKNVAEKFPYLKFIAWDVVVTNYGFFVIEANASSSLELFQIFGSIKNNELWDFYKYYKIVK